MSKFAIASLLAVSALISGAAGIATAATKQTPATKTAATKPATRVATVRATPTMGNRAVAASHVMPRAKPVAHVAAARPAASVGGRMVATKTSTGKAITYNCAKAGNANKKACK